MLFSDKPEVFAKGHEFVQIHGLCFGVDIVEVFVFEFVRVEFTVVGEENG